MSKLITILTFTYVHEAHLAKSLLESEEVPVFIKNELTTQVISIYSNAIGGVELQVPEIDQVKAYNILVEGGFITKKEKSTTIDIFKKTKLTNTKTCPFCNSDNISKKRQLNIISVFVFFILGAISPIFRATYICHNCSKEWKWK